jgi:NAD(P)-dependent dehydrogenase (short-subunit alcohol dehydrogenase family)
MLPLLREAPAARIVNVSERRRFADAELRPDLPLSPDLRPVYPASKTALNAMTLAMAIELESSRIKVNVACPGFTKLNLNNYTGTRTPARRYALLC